MKIIKPAIYARVSSEQQAQAHTIGSQMAALREKVTSEGLELAGEMEFIDEGYSGATLVRPALERLRDVIAAGAIDRLYVHSPDRLARSYAYQVVLVDEFQRSGVEIIFLNRELGQTPEDSLLLQVQGMIAEYERAKIIERARRGRRHAARSGLVSALSCAPYGYRYITKREGNGQARLEIDNEEARIVKQIFEWVGRERVTLREVCRRLQKNGEISRKGRLIWDRAMIWGVLRNPAYIGEAAFGKTRVGPLRPRLRPRRGQPTQPRRAYSYCDVPREEWITIAVPALVEREVFEAVQEQLRENQRRCRQRAVGTKYLLQGLILCKVCGYALSGTTTGKRIRDNLHYGYYRCLGSEPHRFGGNRICDNRPVATDKIELAVWQEVRRLLEDPARVTDEYRRRLQPETESKHSEIVSIESRMSKLRNGLARLIDSYADGLIEKSEFEPRVKEVRERLEALHRQAEELRDQASLETDLRLVVSTLEQFTSRVKDGLDQADWASKREIIRALVKRVEVERDGVSVVFRVNPLPFDPRPERGNKPHCWRGLP